MEFLKHTHTQQSPYSSSSFGSDGGSVLEEKKWHGLWLSQYLKSVLLSLIKRYVDLLEMEFQN